MPSVGQFLELYREFAIKFRILDTSAEKRDAALSHGAKHFIDFLSPETGDVVSSVREAAAKIEPNGKMRPLGAIITATSVSLFLWWYTIHV